VLVVKNFLSFRFKPLFLVRFTVMLIGLHGIFIIASVALDLVAMHRGHVVNDVDVNVQLLIGISLLYLSTLLRRRKERAWQVGLLVYVFVLGLDLHGLLGTLAADHTSELLLVRGFILPVVIIILLTRIRFACTVKSDQTTFVQSLRFTAVVMAVTFLYGVTGFLLLDKHDFRQEISLPAATHYTIDRFDLTTVRPIVAHTRRAHVFLDSLSVLSIGSLAFAAVSFFQPLRARHLTRHEDILRTKQFIEEFPDDSEAYFKLWPQDKLYFFASSDRGGLAYHVKQGVAIVVGDPFGDHFGGTQAIKEFEDVCYTNDWLPAFVHTKSAWTKTYQIRSFTVQKIGEEAVIDLQKFATETANNKYFRQIRNRFEKQEYQVEVLASPHNPAVIARLRDISSAWLTQPGRSERGLMMGYFDEAYLQQCPIFVVRDAAGTIQAFLNQIPVYGGLEANFDMLRHASGSPGNINDFLLMHFITTLKETGFTHLNLGLCPLAGVDDETDERSVVGSALRFVYSNGDRFYSFKGLYRFKSKYEPDWRTRSLAYKDGVRGFTRTMRALNAAMKARPAR
jgi:phosphatidylglycerol lysyltransferase